MDYEDKIVRLLSSKNYVPMTCEEIASKIRAPEVHEVSQLLSDLTRSGQIVRIKGNRYSLPDVADLVVGRIQIHRSGAGTLYPDDASHPPVDIAPNHTSTAMLHDRVLVRLIEEPIWRVKRRRGKPNDGPSGKVIQVLGLGPHRLNKPTRPAWFFEREKYGGILCDIGSHQFEQFLTYSGATDAEVVHAAVGNYNNPDTPELEDFGEANLVGNNGAANYVRLDWFTPDGLRTWGDGRMIILGTSGYIELRKYVDIARDGTGDHVYLVDQQGEHHIPVDGQVGFRFFGELILDCLNRTEKAMTQAHTFKAAELALTAQAKATRIAG